MHSPKDRYLPGVYHDRCLDCGAMVWSPHIHDKAHEREAMLLELLDGEEVRF